MIIIALILIGIFIVAHKSSRPTATGSITASRTLVYSAIVSVLIFVQIYSMVRKPPTVDYYATRWGPFINYLNQVLAWRGSPHRIPVPGR